MAKLHGCVLIVATGAIAYGFTENGREAQAAGAGPVLGDWGSGYRVPALTSTAVFRAHYGHGPLVFIAYNILSKLGLSSPDGFGQLKVVDLDSLEPSLRAGHPWKYVIGVAPNRGHWMLDFFIVSK